ncbi:sugar-transfer associated ATP-grasp domain-containing protein [Salinicoccus roseus]|uniref:sugar-transfer associated ATP-grasp domain-containing protein n=1 Tax=Salinicoccus roseus TaxID=45670 RepID=UPI0023007362|nr:sugar-transfer associated ATP-grasp domain-containing protein [Salinicoccus roseus]
MNSKAYVKAAATGFMRMINSAYLVKIAAGEYYSIVQKRPLYKNVTIDNHQEKEIQSIWKRHYGKKVPTRWHRLYQSYTGRYNKKYFPEVLFTTKLERRLNDREVARFISDKSFLPMYYRDVEGIRSPDTYLMNNSGIFYTADRRIISREKAASLLWEQGEVIIKPTLDSSSGDSVNRFDFHNGIDRISGDSIEDVFDAYKENFLVQEKIIPSRHLKVLYPDSINTLRVITYLIDDEVKCAPITLSMGRDGNHVDNIQAGGISIAVSDDGMLADEGYTHFGEVHTEHPDTGKPFKGHRLPKIPDVIRMAKEMHEKTPHMRIISWDITIDENEAIVLLEINISGQSVWFPQMVSGKAVFGEDTELMIQMLKK